MLSQAGFRRASSLSAEEISLARKIIGEAQPFQIYFNAALSDLKKGQDNRWFHFSPLGGLAMGIEFDELRVFSTVGEVGEEALTAIGRIPERTEFHVTPPQAEHLRKLGRNRILGERQLRYYHLRQREPFGDDFAGLQRLGASHLGIVENFYSAHYDGTIFSSWMLEQPFWGYFEQGILLAAGGTIVIDHVGRAANIGNFLTAPEARGKGYARLVTKHLLNDLLEKGIDTFTLGTTEENIAAWKTYEAVGFSLLEKRVEIEFSHARGGA